LTVSEITIEEQNQLSVIFCPKDFFMFQKLTKLVLLPAVAAVLVACGGGGAPSAGTGGSSNMAVPVVINAVPPQ
jgi:hypothetical protein